jgi:predicted kinase
MSGAPGAGKSTMAKLLGQPLGAVVIDHDIIKSTLLADGNISFDQAAKIAYSLCWTLAESMMQQGLSVIVDSVCNYQETLDQGFRLAELFGFEYWYVECRVDDMELLDQRLQQRVPLRSQRTGVDRPPVDAISCRQGEESRALFKRWMEDPCRPREGDKAGVVVVDSTGSPEQRRDDVLQQMALQPTR